MAKGPKPDLRVVPKGERIGPAADRPAHLGAHGAAFWDAWYDRLCRDGVVTELELPAFVTLCELHESKRRLWDSWKGSPLDGTEKNAAWMQYQQAAKEERMWLEAFGLTPTTRSKRPDAPSRGSRLERLKSV